MAAIRSVTVAVISPRSRVRARACRRSRRISRWSSSTRSGTKARVKRVRRKEIWLSTPERHDDHDQVLKQRDQRGGDHGLGLVHFRDQGGDQLARAGALEEGEIEGQQVIEEPDPKIADQALLRPHRDLGRGVGQGVLDQQPQRQDHHQPGRRRAGREAGHQRIHQAVHPGLELGRAGPERAGGAEQVLEQRDQDDQHEAVEHRGERGGQPARRRGAPSRGAPSAGAEARSAPVRRREASAGRSGGSLPPARRRRGGRRRGSGPGTPAASWGTRRTGPPWRGGAGCPGARAGRPKLARSSTTSAASGSWARRSSPNL